MRQLLLGLIIFLSATQLACAVVIINEISPRTDPEWVELYNNDSVIIDLTNWYLIDKANNKEVLSNLGTISPNTYIIFSRPKGWLNDTTDDLYLFSSSENRIDSVSYPSIEENKSVARIPDITGSWLTNQSLTPGYSNDPLVIVSPSPSISPSSSPTPIYAPTVAIVPSPSQSPSPSPSPSLVPIPSPSPSVTPKPKPSLDPSPQVGTVAGTTTEIDLSGFGVSPSPYLQRDKLDEPSSHAPALNKSRARLALICGTGLILISISGYFLYRQYQKSHIITK